MPRLGRYEILKHLAHGGMAEVLLARSTGIEGFERHVVIKRIRAEQARDEQFVKMFLDEARLAAALHHQNIVQVHDIGQEQGEYFFAMEYVHGEDVRTLLRQASVRKQQLPIEHAITIVAAAAAGLHYAHEQRGPDRKPLGIVHRDISPANILIGFDGGVKVVDFGIAKAAHRSVETQSGTLKGKVAYMSPEQCTGKAVDRRADVFALGIVLYELVTVRRLFKADSDFLMMTAIVQGQIPPPSQIRPDLPPGLEAIILKALAVKPEDRYPTADALRLALEQFANQAGLQTSPTLLADYIKDQFGNRAEPWLVDDEAPDNRDIDFDGSASSLVAPPSDVASALALPADVLTSPSSPIMKARTKEITQAPLSKIMKGWEGAGRADASPTAPRAKSPTTASGTPMAWAPEQLEISHPARRRTLPILLGLGAVAAIGIVAFVALTRGGETARNDPAAANRPVAVGSDGSANVEAPDAGVASPVPVAVADAAVVEPDAQPSVAIQPTKPEVGTTVKPVKPVVKPVKPAVKPVVKPVVKPDKPVPPPIKEDLDSPFPH